MINRKVVGAQYGLRDWLVQRITAIIMGVYAPLMVVLLLIYPPVDHQAWVDLMSKGPVTLLTGLFGLALFYHAWIGIRDIWMDYIKPVWLRVTLHVLTLCSLIIYAGWLLFILWRL